MKKWILILLVVWVGPLDRPLRAVQADHPAGALQGDYRHDSFWMFASSVRAFADHLKDFDKLRANASEKEKAEALLNLKFDALGISDSKKSFLEFYLKTKFPRKAVPIIKPVAIFVQTDQFQKGKKLLPQNIKDADIYSKIPFPSEQQFDQYITEAYYGGITPTNRY